VITICCPPNQLDGWPILGLKALVKEHKLCFTRRILETFPVCLELPKHIPERKMIQRPLAPTSVRELGEL